MQKGRAAMAPPPASESSSNNARSSSVTRVHHYEGRQKHREHREQHRGTGGDGLRGFVEGGNARSALDLEEKSRKELSVSSLGFVRFVVGLLERIRFPFLLFFLGSVGGPCTALYRTLCHDLDFPFSGT
jgi:hypothetical protein